MSFTRPELSGEAEAKLAQTSPHECGSAYGRRQLQEPKMGTSRKGPSVHVVPSHSKPGKFVNKVEGQSKPISRPATQAESIAKAIPIAKHNKAEVVIHGRDGKIRDKDSYGNDPNPPRDKKH
jgi:hypothetical protein